MALRKLALPLLATFVLAIGLAAAAQNNAAQPDEPTAVLRFLNETVTWYRSILLQQQTASDAADLVFAENSRGIALQVLRLSFEFGLSDAALLQAESKRNAGEQPQADNPPPTSRNLTQAMANAQARLKQAQSDLDSLERQLDTASGNKRQLLLDQIAEQKSELDLAQARFQTISSFVDFASTSGASATGLQAKILELERTVPEARSSKTPPTAQQQQQAASDATSSATTTTTAVTPVRARTDNEGVIALTSNLFSLSRKLRSQEEALDNTTHLRDQVASIRSPLIARLRAITAQGDQLSAAPQTNDAKVLLDRRKTLDDLTAQFKQLSAVVVPIGKVGILLDAERSNLSQWHADTQREYTVQLRSLALRMIVLAIAIGVIFLFSELWRRATFRYVHDVRRRSQFLLLRRILVTFTVIIVLLFGFANEIGSLATFAGLITAGVALALQNVILSVAAYFFLIGKYGIRVGDRVQIGDVTGDVVDIGLVRLHLLELDTSTGDPQPTGRVVVFSNSVVFQPTSNFFRQLPGSNFGWHRITLNLAPDVDYHVAKKRINDAVHEVYDEYRQEIERQHRNLEQNLTIAIAVPEPHTSIRFRDTSLEIAVRYPVLLSDVSSIDDRVTRAILAAVDVDPKLKLVGTGTPTIQTVHDPKKK